MPKRQLRDFMRDPLARCGRHRVNRSALVLLHVPADEFLDRVGQHEAGKAIGVVHMAMS